MSIPTLRQSVEHMLAVRKLKSDRDYTKRLQNLKDWLDLPVTAITSKMVLDRHADMSRAAIRSDHSGRANADLTFKVLRTVLNFARCYEDIDGNPVLVRNAVDVLRETRAWNKVKPRESVISAPQIRPWFRAVMNLNDSTVRDYLLLLILTGLRRDEGLKLAWHRTVSEGWVDLDKGFIIIANTKNGDTHRLPLSDFLWSMLRKRSEVSCSDWVFPGKLPQSHLSNPSGSYKRVAKLSGVSFMPHDLRRSFLTVGDALGLEHSILKRLANHRGRSVTDCYIIKDPELLRDPMQKITNQVLMLAGYKMSRVSYVSLAPFGELSELILPYARQVTEPSFGNVSIVVS